MGESQIGVVRGFLTDPPAAGYSPRSVAKQEEEEEQEGGARKSREGTRTREARENARAVDDEMAERESERERERERG